MSTAEIVPDSKWLEPSTRESRESLTRVQSIIGDFDNDHTMKYYDYWSQHYEKDLEVLDYNVPNEMVYCLQDKIAPEEFLKEDYLILDIGAGTGQMANALKDKAEFAGIIDAVDGNGKMLSKALEKELYRINIVHLLLEDKPMPINSNHYDAVVCCCAMVPGLIQPECLPEMVRVVKPGGIFCFTTRATDGNEAFVKRVTNQIEKMSNDGLIELFSTKTVPQYSWPVDVGLTMDKKEDYEDSKKDCKHCISACVYGIKKLKAS